VTEVPEVASHCRWVAGILEDRVILVWIRPVTGLAGLANCDRPNLSIKFHLNIHTPASSLLDPVGGCTSTGVITLILVPRKPLLDVH